MDGNFFWKCKIHCFFYILKVSFTIIQIINDANNISVPGHLNPDGRTFNSHRLDRLDLRLSLESLNGGRLLLDNDNLTRS